MVDKNRTLAQAMFLGQSREFDLSISIEPGGSLVQMSYPHAAVHRDTIINGNDRQATGDTEILYLFTAGATLQPHLEYVIKASGGVLVRFYEAPTVTAPGTPITTSRLFRPSEKTTQATITVGGAVSDYGTLLKSQDNGGGGTGANIRGGAAVHDDAEWVLKLGTIYAIRITRETSGSVGLEMEWYEVPAL